MSYTTLFDITEATLIVTILVVAGAMAFFIAEVIKDIFRGDRK